MDEEAYPPGARPAADASERVVLGRSEGAVEHEIENEYILYSTATDEIFVLNQTAWVIWRLCDGTRTLQELAEDVAILFDVAFEMVLEDVERLSGEMLERGLIAKHPA